MKHTAITPMKYLLTTLLLILFLLLSCGVEESTAPSGGTTSDYMSFALTNSSGASVNLSTELSRGNTYGLAIKREGGASLQTANYDIKATPPDAITINVRRSNSIDFTVNNTDVRSVTITATHEENSVISNSLVLRLAPLVVTPFQEDIEYTVTVPNFTTAKSSLTPEVLGPLGARASATLVKRYVTEAGAGVYDGSSWANAWAATNLRNGINAIVDATANKVYLIMIAGGTYMPTYGGNQDQDISFSMKNYVAIMGGFQDGGGWGRTGTTFMSGDIKVTGDNSDNIYNVFQHIDTPLDNSHIYGVTINNGNAINGVTSEQQRGGGMYNRSSSPNLTQVIFSGNIALEGGGMYNRSSSPNLNQVTFSGNNGNYGGGIYNTHGSSPNLNQVTFSGNTANGNGGGMHNATSSPALNQVVFSENTAVQGGGGVYNDNSPSVITNTVFSGNTAKQGGGMHNYFSSPITRNTVFSSNTADNGGGMYNAVSSPVVSYTVFSGNTAKQGGGMYNFSSSAPVLVGTVFSGNSANNGGGMANKNNGGTGLRILNTIFFDNKTNNGTGAGPDIAIDFADGTENITIAGSALGTYLTTGQPTNAIVGFNGSGTININYHSLSRNAVNLGTATLTVNEMNFTYPTITSDSSAINLGLYVRKSGTTYYFSADNNTWYSGFNTAGNFSGDSVTPPANAEDMTATDIAGKARTGRPDAGVNEL